MRIEHAGEQKKHSWMIDGFNDWRLLWRDPYHLLFFLPWWLFFVAIALVYISTNLMFAVLYYLDISGIANTTSQSFLEAFFFSVQTYGTIGYGAIYPKSNYVNTIVTVESLISLIEHAVLTGLIFGRFSRSSARIIFSNIATVTPYNGLPTLMFRLANQRTNLILEARLSAYLLINEVSIEGQKLRRFHDLKLIRDKTPNFILSWLAMHTIDESSPLFNLSSAELNDRKAVIIVNVIGLDETVMQELHARHTYEVADIIWHYRFVDIFHQSPSGKTRLNYRNFNLVEPVVGIENNPRDITSHK